VAWANAETAVKQTKTNLDSANRMQGILQRKLANGDYSMEGIPTVTKRTFGGSTMANDDSSTPTTKRT